MKKNNNYGFMLIETLLVSTFVLSVLTYLFLQFSALKRSYDDSFRYDTVPNLYALKNINKYITKQNGYTTLINTPDTPENLELLQTLGYTEFLCAFISGASCDYFVRDMNVDKIYLVKDSIFKDKVNLDNSLFINDEELYYFVKKIKFSGDDTAYHLIAKFNDNTFATTKITL